MRGKYETTSDDRRRFFMEVQRFYRPDVEEVDLTNTHLSFHNCNVLLGQLGYEQDSYEVDAGEGEIWAIYRQEDAPGIVVLSDAYLGRLKLFWSNENGDEGGIPENVDRFRELMKKHWGKYFPVI